MTSALDEYEIPPVADPGQDLLDAPEGTSPAAPPLDEPAAAGPAPGPPPRRRPGPPPDPNSQRSKRRAAKKATAPRRRSTVNRPAGPPDPEPTDNPYERGAQAIISWGARPLAMAGLGLALAASQLPTLPDGRATPRAERLAKQGQALSLDSATFVAFGPELARGVAGIAEHIPWMAGALEKAAKISPFAALLEAASAIALQMMANHGLVPASPMLGTLTAVELRALVGLQEPPPPGE